MLLNLHVKNLALIDEIEVYFGNGLNILTGETGAGKSIIIGSVMLALGGKFAKDMLRENNEDAFVELVFEVDNPVQLEKIKQLSIEPEDGQIIMSRRFSSGRSVSKVNGETVTASVLQKLSGILIDIYGQHESQSLLDKKKHLQILDSYAKKAFGSGKVILAEAYKNYKELSEKLEQSRMDEEQRSRESAFLQFEIQEIEEANLQIGEDEDLECSYRKMQHGKKIIEAVTDVHQLTGYEQQQAAGEQVGHAVIKLAGVAEYDEPLMEMKTQLDDIDALLNDFNRELAAYISNIHFSEEELLRTEERLNQINHLKSKYGKTISDIINYQKEKEKELEQLLDYEAYIAGLLKEKEKAENELKKISDKISAVRKKCAKELTVQIKEHLIDLNFLDVAFDMEFKKTESYTVNGTDEVQFMISTNPGEHMKPIGKIASGGELSRIMLAVKTVLSSQDDIETLIFDEIDTGISGRTAQKVSEKMALIGKNRQIICITHLPQIAAMADLHFLIEKRVYKKETTTNIKKLNKEEEFGELARILGGAEITETVRKNAVEMKELANRTKKY